MTAAAAFPDFPAHQARGWPPHGGSYPPVPGASYREVERPGDPSKGAPSCHAVSPAPSRSSRPSAVAAALTAGTGAAAAAESMSATPGAGSSRPPGAPVPARTCAACGEFLPHACAPVITITRPRWALRRQVEIRDRQPVAEAEAG